MMDTITQNCGLYIAQKLAKHYEAHPSHWWRLFHASKRKRTVRAPKDMRRFHLQGR